MPVQGRCHHHDVTRPTHRTAPVGRSLRESARASSRCSSRTSLRVASQMLDAGSLRDSTMECLVREEVRVAFNIDTDRTSYACVVGHPSTSSSCVRSSTSLWVATPMTVVHSAMTRSDDLVVATDQVWSVVGPRAKARISLVNAARCTDTPRRCASGYRRKEGCS